MSTPRFTAPGSLAALLLALASTSPPARAQNLCQIDQVVPPEYARVEANGQTVLPFSTVAPKRIMYAYGRSAAGLDRTVRLSGIRLRANGGPQATVAVTYDFRLLVSTSRRPARTLNPVFDENHGADATAVFDGLLTNPATSLGMTPNPFILHIPFRSEFEWDPRSGPLLFDFQFRSGSAPAGAEWDALTGTGAEVGRIADFSSANAPNATYLGGATQDLALVLELCFAADVTPQTYRSTQASSSSAHPWRAHNPMRVLDAYGPDTFAIAERKRITALAWRTTNGASFQGSRYDLKITLSTNSGPPSGLSTTFASNHGPDARVVFDGIHVAPQQPGLHASTPRPGPFALVIPLSEPFEYNPRHGSLIVDLQMRNSPVTPGVGATFEGTSSDNAYRIVHTQDANASVANGGPPQRFAYVMGLMAEEANTLPPIRDGSFGSLTQHPWNASPHRLLTFYPEVNVTQPTYIQHLRWQPSNYVSAYGPATFSCTIDLSHRSRASVPLSTNFDSNHVLFRQRVFEGTFTVPHVVDTSDPLSFPISVRLDTPYVFHPALPWLGRQGLVVDIRVLHSVGATSLLDAESGVGNVASILHGSDPNATVANSPGVLSLGPVLSIVGDEPNATSEIYGFGCAGSQGTPRCAASRLPTLPSPAFAMELLDGPRTSTAFLLLGVTQSSIPLDGAGLPGCFLWTGAEVGSFAVPTASDGSAALPLPLPADPLLEGFSFTTQWFGIDPLANAGGMVASDAQEHTLRLR